MQPDFWRSRRVFMTGHTGFKGSWCALWLRRHGAQVRGYSLEPPTDPSLFQQARVGDLIDDVRGDIRDLAPLAKSLRDFGPDVVLHFAAQPLVLESYTAPVETYATNVMGTVHVLEAVRHCEGVRAVLIVTSDKCYENRGWIWGYRENDPIGGHDPYSSSKGCAELVTDAFRRSFFARKEAQSEGPGIASVRAGNVIGGGDWAPDRLIPDAVRAIQAGTRLQLRNPEATRPWQHVLDPLHGYLVLAEALFEDSTLGEGWNFGPAAEGSRTVREVVDELARHHAGAGGWDLAPDATPHEARSLALDCRKAHTILRWRPCLEFEQAIQWTAEWYAAVAGGADARTSCTEQIERFERVVSEA